LTKTNKILINFSKILLFVLLLYILFYQLKNKQVSFNDFKNISSNISINSFIYLGLAIILMPVNWFLESFKWKKLVNVIQSDYTFIDAVKSVLIGVFFGFITPNRVGEFGGRLLFIKKGNKLKALNLTFIGGLAQFIITFLIGSFFGSLLLTGFFGLYKVLYLLIFPIFIIFSLLIYFNIKDLSKKIFSFNIFKKFSEKYIFNFSISSSFLSQNILITLFRYTIYVFQYILIIKFVGIELDWIFSVQIITTMLFLQTIIPSFALIDLGIRSNILLYLLSDYAENQLVVLFVVFLVWILNLVIPAVLGYFYLLNLKTEEHYEKLTDNYIHND